jgi:hypothetical protein
MGDLNTMGLNYPTPNNGIVKTSDELEYIKYVCEKKESGVSANLKILTQPETTEYSEKFGFSNLDHVVSSNSIEIVAQKDEVDGEEYQVKIGGWRKYMNNIDKLKEYIDKYSDHCPIVVKVK